MLLERRPGQPILLCSAIVDDEIRERAAAAGIAACLSKDDFEAIPGARSWRRSEGCAPGVRLARRGGAGSAATSRRLRAALRDLLDTSTTPRRLASLGVPLASSSAADGAAQRAARAAAARLETCSSVTTPRRRPSASTAISAPSGAAARAQQRLQRRVVAHLAVGGELATGMSRARGRGLDAARWASPSGRRLDDREPRPALVAQEEVLVGRCDRQVGRDGHRLGVHDVGDGDARPGAR